MVKEKKVMTEVKLIPMSGRRFTEFDDYLIHQVPDTFDVMGYGSQEVNWAEHNWFFLMPPEFGKPYINNIITVRPNAGYMHCSSYLVFEDKQYNFRACRPLEHDRGDTTIGAFSLKHLKPTYLSRIALGRQSDSQVSFDLELERRGETQIYPLYEFNREGDKFRTQWVHTCQSMRCVKGQIRVAGEEYDAKGYQVYKDHCWGIRGPKTIKQPGMEQNFIGYIFAPFQDFTIELCYREAKDATSFGSWGKVVWDNGKAEDINDIKGKFSFAPKTWQVKLAEWTFHVNGKAKKLTAETYYPGGYWAGIWTGERIGDYQGPLRIENDVWHLTQERQAELGNAYRNQVCRCHMDGKQTIGAIEYGFE